MHLTTDQCKPCNIQTGPRSRQLTIGDPPDTSSIPEVAAAEEALYAEVAWKLGPRLRDGVEPPKRKAEHFHDAAAPYVAMNADGTGQWLDPGREERERSMRAQSLQEQARVAEQKQREQESLREFLEGR